jgi:phosphoglycerol transferase MdoB-like AlkP superfamily enzyme
MVGFLVSLIDFELFLFMGKRMSFDLFVITGDIWEQLPQLIIYYWYFPLIAIAIGIIFFIFDKTYFSTKVRTTSILSQVASNIFIIGLAFIGIRGGLQHKSINVQSAFTQGRNELGHLVLNTPYHFLRTLKNQSYTKLNYFQTDNEAINVILGRRDFRPLKQNTQKKNIILLILESFSSEYMENGFTPFLSELQAQSIFFPYHLANGRRSIEVLPSVLCGLPSLLNEPISKSIFQSNKMSCMPKILKNSGYTNYFFHGGSRGTMGFESFTLANGFDRYFSREDHPNGEYDGTWGIYDGPYLEFVATELDKMQQPFLAGIFTLSSHQPYSVPKSMHGKFPKGTLEIHESIGYTDYALKKFFESIQNTSWFKNTIFIITADHTSKLESKKFQNLIGRYRVPLLIYDPSGSLIAETKKVSQHSDIPRTVLGLVGVSEDDMPATSVNLLTQDKGYALNYDGENEYFLVSLDEVTTLSKNHHQLSFKYDWESGSLQKIGESDDQLLKAYLQYFFNGMITNHLSIFR